MSLKSDKKITFLCTTSLLAFIWMTESLFIIGRALLNGIFKGENALNAVILESKLENDKYVMNF